MRMYDIIQTKRDGGELDGEQIRFFVDGYTRGEIPDYQASALMMAIFLRGCGERETVDLALAMAHSGETMDLSSVPGVKVDKHSTGGIGDKTSLIVAPIAAACSLTVAKLSGRGLGYTGGTIDKLESIDGVDTELSMEAFLRTVAKNGLCIASQSAELAPADKKMYALRDVTATVESLPLIASSIMSKKLASGADCIALDVKCGCGAFMKTFEEAEALAKSMVDIGKRAGRRVSALITDMDAPLGRAVGNTLEIAEAADILAGKAESESEKRLVELSLALASELIEAGLKLAPEEAEKRAKKALSSGRALEKLALLVESLGGDGAVIYDTAKLKKARFSREIYAAADGFIGRIDAQKVGMASLALGAGRLKKGDGIDRYAGLLIEKTVGESVKKGEPLARVFSSDESRLDEGARLFSEALSIAGKKPETRPLIFARIK